MEELCLISSLILLKGLKSPRTKMAKGGDKSRKTRATDGKSRRQTKMKREEAEEQEVVVARKIQFRCRPQSLIELISNFNDRQRDSVIRIGFGGLLSMRLKSFPGKYAVEFMTLFADDTLIFRLPRKSDQFLVTKHDVHDCFLIPYGPNPAELLPMGRSKEALAEDVVSLKQAFRDRFNIPTASDTIPLSLLLEELQKDVHGGDDFCRLFVLYSMSIFLNPTLNYTVDLSLLRCVENVDQIRNYDWCTLVLNGLAAACQDYVLHKPTYLLGCLPFLMITYFHRFQYRDHRCPHDLPLIKHWDRERMIDRLYGEFVGGGLGRLTKSKVKYPRCLLEKVVDEEVVDDGVPLRITNAPTPSAHKSVKSINIELADGVEDDADLRAKAVDEVHELYLMMARNAVAFHDWWISAASKLRRITSGKPLNDDPVPSQASQDFWSGEELHRTVDEVCEAYARAKNAATQGPAFTGQPTHTAGSSMRTNVAGVEDVVTADESRGCSDFELYTTAEMVEAVNGGSEDRDHQIDEANVIEDLWVEVDGRKVFHPYFLHSEKYLDCMQVVDEKLGCSYDCGTPEPDQIIVSDFLVRNSTLFRSVLSVRKDVMDYVFYNNDKYSASEMLVRVDDFFNVPRDELSTLQPGQQLSNAVIDTWCILLNSLDASQTAPRPTSRCFFGVSHNKTVMKLWKGTKSGAKVDVGDELFNFWDIWTEVNKDTINLDSDLVFVPVLSDNNDHYSCACINFLSKQIEYLDNRSYEEEEFESLPYVGMAKIAAVEMGKYMVKKGIVRGSDVAGFPVVNVPFA